MKNHPRLKIGFIGLGAMGAPMVKHLLAAGYDVSGYDIRPERRTSPELSLAGVVAQADVVLTSLPSSEAFVSVAENELVPAAKAGQVFIETGTTTPLEIRRLAGLFAARGAALLDAPVSGGPQGGERADLWMWVGGDEAVFEWSRPILEALAGKGKLFHCGASGAGQIIKGVNQLKSALHNAAYLEALAFAVNAGLDAALVQRAFGGDKQTWPLGITGAAWQASQGQAEGIGVKFRELPYYLREAKERGFELPLTATLYAFMEDGERVVIDDNRPAPSFWRELTKKVHP
jgi:3-hydroxyisobutyrate dehydrogenase-like beta-hydroxyacid dehydrogenase